MARMARNLKRDLLRLDKLVVTGEFAYPVALATAVPPALSARDAAMIYGEIARFGFAQFQQVSGGAMITSADQASTVVVTATNWQFAQDMAKSPGFRPVLDQVGVVVGLLLDKLPPEVVIARQGIDLTALWALGEAADSYISEAFLGPRAAELAAGLGDLRFNGGAIRLNFVRDSDIPVPPGMETLAPEAVEEYDVRVEPFFRDKSHLFIQVTGTQPVPIREVALLERRVEYAHSLLWDRVADALGGAD